MTARASIIQRADATGVPLLVVRLLLGGLFVWMGFHKLADPITFLKQVHLYDLLPESPSLLLNATAIVLPWLEIICGVLLLLGFFVRGAAAQLVVMFCVFTPAIFLRAMAIRAAEGTPFFEIAFDCGCGSGVVIIWKKLLTNAGLFALSLLAMISRSRRFCLSMWFERRRMDPAFCHLCGYAARSTTAGVCDCCYSPASGEPARDQDKEAA